MTKNNSGKNVYIYRYQELVQKHLTELSTAEQTVASHLAAHPEQLPFETASSLAKRLGVSSMTVGRTLKGLGYRGLADIRTEMRQVSDAVPWSRRGVIKSPPALKNVDRRRALNAELEAIETLHALAESPAWLKAAQLIAGADQVFVAGFQSERGLALAFADQLAYVRPGVRYLSVEDRAFADLRTEACARSCVVIVDCRRYSRWFRVLGEKAVALGVPLVIVTDAYCSWANDLTPYALQARTDSGRFWDNNAPILSLMNLLIEDVIEQLGEAVHSQLDGASEFGAAFVGFERVHRRRRSKKGARASQGPANLRGAGDEHKGARAKR
jgi:DNA-binding MurR/RpiR family transcriptional regulator